MSASASASASAPARARSGGIDWTPALIKSYVHHAKSIMGKDQELMGTSFTNVEDRMEAVRTLLSRWKCSAINRNKFHYFQLLSPDGPRDPKIKAAIKPIAPGGLLRTLAEAHEFVSSMMPK